MTFDMDPLLEMRKTLNEQLSKSGVKLSVNDFLVRCCALSMATNPEFNASFGGDCIHYHGPVNVGIAIALPEERGGGLVVGTIRNADQKSLRTISQESAYLSTKARETGLSTEEMGDTTFTISNLGMFGVDNFTAIINPPNSAILAVVRGGELVVGHELSATLSLDHRVIDGAMAAMYLKTLKELIENPASLLV
jgi:pyruvate dehydrogenase E2 component (dihydrolipoamide acetyltransferase)